MISVLFPTRPWLTPDRAPTALPERRNPPVKWWDEAAGRLLAAARPLIRRPGLSDRVFARRVIRRQKTCAALSDADLLEAARALGPALLRNGLTGRAAAQAFALAREATFRELGYRHHKVQILGARRILTGHLTEMATGEGKTATTVLAAATAALAGVPTHVITVNDYLCQRDFETLSPIYARLGLSAALIDPEADMAQKARDYSAAITHVSNKTLVFDYLRSRLNRGDLASPSRAAAARLSGGKAEPTAPPLLAFAIVDEADSVLIDEAQTPLIIAAPHQRTRIEDCHVALSIARTLQPARHYHLRADSRRIDLTDQGRGAIAHAATGNGGLWEIPRARAELVSQALSALHLHHRDQHYIVADDAVQIVDEFTGRVLADRQWQSGLHQMVEVKEGLEISPERQTLAQLTFQEFFRRYLWFGGMSGTLGEVSREMARVYDRPIATIPTHRPVIRKDLPPRLFRTEAHKLKAVAERAARLAASGRPVLIGTRSVEVSERVSAVLGATPHQVLNARQDADEARIIADAGRAGQITIATNMAGRGTDIKLSEAARRNGGLHVVLTEFHESRRIDRQLMGRAGRQGDPGSTQAMVAITDPILRRFAPGACRLATGVSRSWPAPLPAALATYLRRRAQAGAERLAARNRDATLRRSRKLNAMMAFTGERTG